jgi:1-acyl-sn-glycerol-3-phosphate acyltransferase
MDDWKYQSARDLDLGTRERLRSVQRETGPISSAVRFLWWTMLRGHLALFHRLRIEGRDRIPREPPFLMISNHTSHLDAPALATALPPTRIRSTYSIASATTFFEGDAQALFSSLLINALPLTRERCGAHTLEHLRRRLIEEPCVYIIFPEGTRSRSGTISNFKPGFGRLIAGTPVPVVPCHIAGAFEAWPATRRWPRPGAVRVRVGAPLVFEDVPANRAGWEQIARRAEEAVQGLGEVPSRLMSPT